MKNKKISILVLFIVCLLLSSCGENSNKKPITIEQKERAPEALKKVYTDIGSIMEKTEKVVEKKKIEDVEIKKDLEKILKQIDRDIKRVHEQWNKYEVEGLKKGSTQESINKLQTSLNEMTVAVENRDFSNVLMKGSEFFLNISPFFDLYKDEIYGDISRIKYFVYQGFLYRQKGDIEKATNSLKQVGEPINRIKLKLEGDKKRIKNLEKLNQSIEDMRFSLKENSSQLLVIKKDIIIKNLKELER